MNKMNKKIRYVLFDLDGTLTDSGPGIRNAVKYALQKIGFEAPSDSVLNQFIGPPLHLTFSRLYGLSEENAAGAVTFFREYYRRQGYLENAVYEGIPELLNALKKRGMTLAVATCKPQDMAEKVLRHFHLDDYFSYICCASYDASREHKSDVIAYLLQENHIPKDEAVMVGDRQDDMKGAFDNGITSIGVLYGFGSEEELKLSGADYTVNTPTDILGIF